MKKSLINFMLAAIVLLAFNVQVYADNLGNEVGTYELLDNAARTTTVGTYGSKVIDRINFRSGVGILQSAKSTAGTACTLRVVVEESNASSNGYVNNKTATDTGTYGLNSDNSNVKHALKFTQTAARTIDVVYLKLKRTGTITAGKKIWVGIQTHTTEPSGTRVHADAIDSVLCSAISSTAYTFVAFAFDRAIDLAASTSYYIVLEADYDASETNCIRIYTEDVVSGGDFWSCANTGTWTNTTTQSWVAYTTQYTFTAVDTFSLATENAGIFNTVDINFRDLKRYLRVKATSIGTSASFVSSAVLICGEAHKKPVTD